ncbi:hypothetical protein NXW89_19320 [Bacteroides thetaiotaomicron]|nr:hypothetical protein [Bacteroides thetaiotaomicron]
MKTQSVSVARTTQTYTNRFTEQGEINMKFKTGATEYPFYIDVTESGIDLQETTAGLVLKLSAAGRVTVNPIREPGIMATYIQRLRVSTGTATAGRVTP